MSLLIVMPHRPVEPLTQALTRCDPDLPVQVWPTVSDPPAVRMAVTWQHPPGALKHLPNLQGVVSYGAGVDHLLQDPALPPVPLGRLVASGLGPTIAEYVLAAVLAHRRGLLDYARTTRWAPRDYGPTSAVVAGVLGLGTMGVAIAQRLRGAGFEVRGWRRGRGDVPSVQVYRGAEALSPFAQNLAYLVCALPLTPATEGILNADLFAHLARGAYVINVGRGGHLVDADLIDAITAKRLSGACLDAFVEEPLPQQHPFWKIPEITVTPHVASLTDPEEAATHLVEDYRRLTQGQALKNPVDPDVGY